MTDDHTFCDSDCAWRWCAWHRSHIQPGWTTVGRDLRCAHYRSPGAFLSDIKRPNCPVGPTNDPADGSE